MKTFKQFLRENYTLNEMANIEPSVTGLSTNIYVSRKKESSPKHSARLKFTDPDTKKQIPIGIVEIGENDAIFKPKNVKNYEKHLKLINRIREWINLNFSVLNKYWESDPDIEEKNYTTEQLKNDIQKLE